MPLQRVIFSARGLFTTMRNNDTIQTEQTAVSEGELRMKKRHGTATDLAEDNTNKRYDQ
jgi:hypothetical protein